MKTIRNVIAGGMIALAVGFAGGELLGPTATSATAQTPCDMQICYTQGFPSEPCQASAALVYCDVNEFLGREIDERHFGMEGRRR